MGPTLGFCLRAERSSCVCAAAKAPTRGGLPGQDSPGITQDLSWEITSGAGGRALRLICDDKNIRSATTETKQRVGAPLDKDILHWLSAKRKYALDETGDCPVFQI